MIQKALKAGLFGGCIGLVGQAFIALISGFIQDPMLATIIAMLIFGLVSAVIIATGLYDKIAAFAGFGADQPLCGLMYGATGIAAGTKASGAPAGKAVIAGFVKVMIIVGIGFVLSAILGLIFG